MGLFGSNRSSSNTSNIQRTEANEIDQDDQAINVGTQAIIQHSLLTSVAEGGSSSTVRGVNGIGNVVNINNSTTDRGSIDKSFDLVEDSHRRNTSLLEDVHRRNIEFSETLIDDGFDFAGRTIDANRRVSEEAIDTVGRTFREAAELTENIVDKSFEEVGKSHGQALSFARVSNTDALRAIQSNNSETRKLVTEAITTAKELSQEAARDAGENVLINFTKFGALAFAAIGVGMIFKGK